MFVFLLLSNTWFNSTFLTFKKIIFPPILESRSKQIRLPSPQHEQRSSVSYTSPSATHTTRETCSFPAHSDPTLTHINPPGSTPTSHQAHLPSQSAKKEKHSPKKEHKEHKNKHPLEDFINSPFSLENVMMLFKPMPSCISPLQDLVRI